LATVMARKRAREKEAGRGGEKAPPRVLERARKKEAGRGGEKAPLREEELSAPTKASAMEMACWALAMAARSTAGKMAPNSNLPREKRPQNASHSSATE